VKQRKEWGVGGGSSVGLIESLVKQGNDQMESSGRKREMGQVSSQRR